MGQRTGRSDAHLLGGLAGPSLGRRVLTAGLLVLGWFVLVTLASGWLLPEGVLRGRAPGQGWEGSGDVLVLALQILAYNLISVVVIAGASFFATAYRWTDGRYLSVGYLVLAVQVTLNAVVLGTWSFSTSLAAPPLGERLLGMLDLTQRSGLWEMAGQVLVASALARMATVRTHAGTTTTRPWSQARPSRAEVGVVALGLALMALGAAIEAFALRS